MKSGCVLFSALLLFCTAGVTESVLVDEYSMQLTVRALLGEEMRTLFFDLRTQDKKISDVEKQMEKQRQATCGPR